MTDPIPSWLDPTTLRWVADELDAESEAAWQVRNSSQEDARHYPDGSVQHQKHVIAAVQHGTLGRRLRQEAVRLRKLATRRERDQ